MMHIIRNAAMLAVFSLFTATGFAQTIALVDFERAVVTSAEGKKAEAQFTTKFEERKSEIEKKQKELEDKQNQLKTQDRVLSDTAKAELSRDIERRSTELTRLNEDAQKELETLRQQLLGPVIEIARRILQAYASEKGYVVVIDTSAPENNVLFVNKAYEITDELVKRIDAAVAAAKPTNTGQK
jgi:Skp family chaperone for outer membrane proteins